MSSPNPISTPENSVDPAPKPTRRTFTAEYRNKILDEYNQAPYGEKSAVLRREGLPVAIARMERDTGQQTTCQS